MCKREKGDQIKEISFPSSVYLFPTPGLYLSLGKRAVLFSADKSGDAAVPFPCCCDAGGSPAMVPFPQNIQNYGYVFGTKKNLLSDTGPDAFVLLPNFVRTHF